MLQAMISPPDHEYNADLRDERSTDDVEHEKASASIMAGCDHCGAHPHTLEINGNRRDGWYVQCPDCGIRTAGSSTYAIAVESWDRRTPSLTPKQIGDVLSFAARYSHNRQTGAAMLVVQAIKRSWPMLSEQTREQIIKETDEATTNRDDWNGLIVFAATFKAMKHETPTPLTDAFIGDQTGVILTPGEEAMCDFARDLERENSRLIENSRLLSIILRAETKFFEEGSDGAIAAAMFTILSEARKTIP